MRSRSLLVTAAVAALALPGTATAGPVCNLVRDSANDTGVVSPAGPVRAPAFDIRTLDVASGKKTLVVMLRMATTKIADDPAATLGMTWDVTFKIGEVGHRFSRQVGPNGIVIAEKATADGKTINGLAVKTDGNAIRWTVPRGGVPKLKKGAVLHSFYASTSAPSASYDMAPNGGVASPAKYKDMQASCVKPA